jgi:hypothetical protein
MHSSIPLWLAWSALFAAACSAGGFGPRSDGSVDACANGACAVEDGAGAARKRVFITRQTWTGDLTLASGQTTGLASGDTYCSRAAQAAGLGGTFVAWLSDTQTDAITRVADASPWYLVDRATMVFPSKAELATVPMVPIVMDEAGGHTEGDVWTGTLYGGTEGCTQGSGVNCCADWMLGGASSDEAVIGLSATTQGWTSGSSLPLEPASRFGGCGGARHLYCFEQ